MTDSSTNDTASSATLRLGTRGSALARWQADHVTELLKSIGARVEQVLITTQGDRNQQGPIGALGGQGVFTKEIQRALLDEEVDIAVHSLKDLPTDPTPGLELAAVPERERIADALICRVASGFDTLPQGAVVGTGSVRRQAQLLYLRPDLEMRDIRGNVETRLQKLDDGQYDAIILAEAGLTRLGLRDRITEVLSEKLVMPAVGQGALGLEIRAGDESTRRWLEPLIDRAALAEVTAERALLRTLRGGCMAPVGAVARAGEHTLILEAVVLSHDGQRRVHAVGVASLDDAEQLGGDVAAKLLDAGAAELIGAARERE
ncbi:MAG: hydroxymethylbilane synthase [Planctomycetales bacterium]|nr:hydroxymethylbilane synthase [Planctomycetales bacterium]